MWRIIGINVTLKQIKFANKKNKLIEQTEGGGIVLEDVNILLP